MTDCPTMSWCRKMNIGQVCADRYLRLLPRVTIIIRIENMTSLAHSNKAVTS